MLFLAACTSTEPPDVLPTLAILPSPTPAPASPLPPTSTPSPVPTATITPTPSHTPTLRPTATATATATPTLRLSLTPSITPTLLPDVFVFGQSVVGRDLLAYRVGWGSNLIFVIGGIHTGFEANTVDLVEAMIDHYRRNAGEIQNGLSFVFIPLLNPDGYT
ncbi:MAG: hypothetical protein D6712_10805, partial [Chloroflexi bacterium]